ncbi:Pineal opsin Pineal gland-specific opsin [Larimichthys crocea]|uniref:Pineal opsin Pineal gland-specific opsin n=1 Tax=Larimichthys crocea TaxID=215358 RepID=A0A6G0IXQ7_LARCR|nr:Pineal opsin Pineal gland-specific opsin [Larimichthys crocea]
MDSNRTLWTSGPHPPSTYIEVVTVAPTIFPRIGYNILSYLMFINTLLSVFNNGIVITVMLRNPSLLQPINVFILSLAVSDLMIGLCGSLVVTITNYQGSFFIGHAACVFQGFAVNYFVIIYCYSKVLTSMNKLNKSVELQGGRSSQKENDHAISMVLAMIIAFFVCWLPYTALSVVVVVDPELYIPPLVATMPMYFAKTSPCL